MYKYIFLFSLILVGATCNNVKTDSSLMSPMEAGDQSAIMMGCGLGHQNGVLSCRLGHQTDITQMITVTVPMVDCPGESCASVIGFQKNGNIIPLGSIPKGQVQLKFPLSKLIGDTVAEKNHGGPYRILIELDYTNKRTEWKQAAEGVIYIMVLDAGYHQLNCDSSNAVWKLPVSPSCEIQFSTKLRAALCGDC